MSPERFVEILKSIKVTDEEGDVVMSGSVYRLGGDVVLIDGHWPLTELVEAINREYEGKDG